MNCDPERPDDAIARILEVCSPYDSRLLTKYLGELEEFHRSRAGFSSNEDLDAKGDPEPMQDSDIKVAEYNFCVVDSSERDDREFELAVFKDRTCRWHDYHGKLRARDLMKLNMETVRDRSRAEREIEREGEFDIEFKISESAYQILVEKEAVQRYQPDLSEEHISAIDECLCAIFWDEINPHLPTRLHRVFAK